MQGVEAMGWRRDALLIDVEVADLADSVESSADRVAVPFDLVPAATARMLAQAGFRRVFTAQLREVPLPRR